ncbi:substrate-binding domain-containing protein [Xylophilus sp.]|uniref:substrate-binding domain-containing protein n=1 Tax=Xylophilus sp. TaxID=2653893 RepID=UPI0013BDBFA6|nr:substrate-binding domain-containing protein [Xylophilus sp.]KAF1041802.1 MAG: Aconitate isomerase [Xylophilus sp.]
MALSCITSMAPRQCVSALARSWDEGTVQVEAIGGVDAAARIAAGWPGDVAVLALDALQALAEAGHVLPRTLAEIAASDTVAAVRDGAPLPLLDTREALVRSLRAARAIGYSTGPSGKAFLALLDTLGVGTELAPRLVQARPGQPVGALVADGTVDLGVQQHSELVGLPGVVIVSALPPGAEISTVFAAAVVAASRQPQAARRFIGHLRSPAAAAAIEAAGMRPA